MNQEAFEEAFEVLSTITSDSFNFEAGAMVTAD